MLDQPSYGLPNLAFRGVLDLYRGPAIMPNVIDCLIELIFHRTSRFDGEIVRLFGTKAEKMQL